MRNSASVRTPKINKVQKDSVLNDAEKSSGKKLKQARLPFKVIAAHAGSEIITSPVAAGKDHCEIKETSAVDFRKRKLSYNTDDDDTNKADQKPHNVSKENVILPAATKKRKLSESSDIVVSLLDDDNDDDGEDIVEDNKEDDNSSAVSVGGKEGDLDLKSTDAVKNEQVGAGSSHTRKDQNGSATKLKIKIPLTSGKKKRRKSVPPKLSQNSATNNNCEKRQKFNISTDETNELGTITLDLATEDAETEIKKSEKGEIFEKCNTKKHEDNLASTSEKSLLNSKCCADEDNENDVKNTEIVDLSDEDETQKNDQENLVEIAASENEADDETDNLTENVVDSQKNSKSNTHNTTQSAKREKNESPFSKNLKPKQLKLMEQRRKAREEKERKLQEEKLRKQQEKEEKELTKKREREEKEELKRKEREEKEELKRKEREEKERKRLAEIEAKNEEKRKKNEAKEEELRKKEEERKRKEQEKEEAELKKKKAAQAFTKFFVAKTPNNAHIKNDDDSNTGDGNKLLAFRPFQIKGAMKLAPIFRKNFTVELKNRLDDLMNYNNNSNVKGTDYEKEILPSKPLPTSDLYLSELQCGKILPGKWRRSSIESKDDLILVDDELERVGQEIVEDTPAYVREEMRVKFYKFHDNRRPPYYGTWRKKSSVVKPKKPFAQDTKFFDYEVDSDDEWEEEEPGESLEDGSDEDREKESEDDEYEVDNEWFVPHGHLSEEELQNEDEIGKENDNTREAQKVKLQLLQQEFAQEMKKKTEKIKPRLIGCIWADINGNQPPECAKILWDTLNNKAMLFIEPPLIDESEVDKSTEPNSPSGTTTSNTDKVTDKSRPISLSDDMIKDLIRLVHGNNHARNFLIKEYIAYIEKTEESIKNGGSRKPLKSVVRDKIDELAEWQSIEATALSIQNVEQASDDTNDKKKKKVKRRLCWVVKQEMLDKLGLSSLELKNSWQYTLQPKSNQIKADKQVTTNEVAAKLDNESLTTSAEKSAKRKHFVNLLKSDDNAKKYQITPSSLETKSNEEPKLKEKKRVPLLMSVARGQQISTPTKNKLISQFLQQQNKDSLNVSSTRSSNVVTSPHVKDDDVVILD